MSPVDEISPCHSFFLQKFRCVHMGRRAGPVTEISVFATEISATELEIFRIFPI